MANSRMARVLFAKANSQRLQPKADDQRPVSIETTSPEAQVDETRSKEQTHEPINQQDEKPIYRAHHSNKMTFHDDDNETTSTHKHEHQQAAKHEQQPNISINLIGRLAKSGSISRLLPSHQKKEATEQEQQRESVAVSTFAQLVRPTHKNPSLISLAALLMWLSISGQTHQPALAEPPGGRVTFEKMTNRDYIGLSYYQAPNVSLFECLGWCREERACTSAVFSFVVNPFAALQETTCQLQNETQARQGAYLRRDGQTGDQVTVVAQTHKANNLYFFNKIELQSESLCNRLWAFERFPNKRLRQRDGPAFHAPSKEACQAACMSEQRFVCRSLEYNYITQSCSLSGLDRRSPSIIHLTAAAAAAASIGGGSHGGDLIDAPAIDYFENACLLGEDICQDSRLYDYAKLPLPPQRTAHFVELNYYPDKEMLVKSQAGCARACTIEHEFICRSILFRAQFKSGQPNCALYHLDQRTFPEGGDTFLGPMTQPLLDSGDSNAIYLEAICNDTIQLPPINNQSANFLNNGNANFNNKQQQAATTITMPPHNLILVPSATTPGGLSVHAGAGSSMHSLNITASQLSSSSMSPFSQSASMAMDASPPISTSEPTRFMVSSTAASSLATSTLSPVVSALASLQQQAGQSSTTLKVPASAFLGPGSSGIPPNLLIPSPSSSGARPLPPQHLTFGPAGVTPSAGQSFARQPAQSAGSSQSGSLQSSASSQMPNHLIISPAPPTRFGEGGLMPSNIHITPVNNNNNLPGANNQLQQTSNHEQNCDSHGFCYDVSLKCTDTKMVINVKTQRPFVGRIYALGRSETCNANIRSQNQFQLDMYLTGQECNTQSASGTYTNTIVLQHHNVVLTKADKVYHVRCTYETSSKNVTFDSMPVKDMFAVDVNDRNQETISITASSDAPLPKISIMTLDGNEASTVRIGDRLTFRIEIPDNTPYGIFARSCVAMAKEGRSTFEIIDDNGCPVDHTIFPQFQPAAQGNALESNYEAFRFTESYGVIFQCNIKYCIGKCQPVNCGIGRDSVESWGRKKRSIGDGGALEMPAQRSRKHKQGQAASNDDMTLSREIVVLDITEKQQANNNNNNVPTSSSGSSPSEQQQPDAGELADVGITHSPLRQTNHGGQSQVDSSPASSEATNNNHHHNKMSYNNKHCISSQSLSILICSIGLLFILYVWIVACMFARRDTKISHIKQQFY